MASIAENETTSKGYLTLDDLRKMEKETITPAVAAQVMGCSQNWIRVYAKQGSLKFPFFFSGNRLKISRIGFIRFMEGETNG